MAWYMQEITVKELQDILKDGIRTVIIPVGVVEQHGISVPLGWTTLPKGRKQVSMPAA